MAKRVLQRYESSAVAMAVKAWLERTGIDPNLVIGWKINQCVGDLSQIELIMYFDDAPVPPPPVDRHPIGERGPEPIELPNVVHENEEQGE